MLLAVQIGDSLVVNEYIIVAIILVLTMLLVVITRFLMNRAIRLASDHLKTDPTKYRFMKHMLTAIIITLGVALAIYTIPALRAIAISLFAGAGIFAVIIGFASQQAFSNIVSGIFIVLFKPFRINDIITVANQYEGIVEDITLRHTVICNWENRRIIIPNSIISNETVVNSSIIDEKTCKYVVFSISYDSDVDLARAIIQEEMLQQAGLLDHRTPEAIAANVPRVFTRIVELGAYSVDIRAYVWAENPLEAFYISTELLDRVKKRFDAADIEIPFPYRTIVYKKDLPDHGGRKLEG